MMMKDPYLEVTFRRGHPLAAYLYLPRQADAKSVRTERSDSGLLIDFDAEGRPIGIEITAPGQVSAAVINRVLAGLGLSPMPEADFAPLRAA
jgi:uncharacterized protein YuzE